MEVLVFSMVLISMIEGDGVKTRGTSNVLEVVILTDEINGIPKLWASGVMVVTVIILC